MHSRLDTILSSHKVNLPEAVKQDLLKWKEGKM
jgi:hypothetical protein